MTNVEAVEVALVDPPAVAPPPAPDPIALVAAAEARTIIRTIAATSNRSQQAAVGMSELAGCGRKLAYRLAGTSPVHAADPLPAFVGTGFHKAVEEGLRRLDGKVHRYLIEHPVVYRFVPGTVDLYDRWNHLVWDWKTTRCKNLATIRTNGPPQSHRVQIMGYAAGLREQGYRVDDAVVVYVPRDGGLEDIHAWRSPVDVRVVDEAIDRLSTLGGPPSQAKPTYTPLCDWCEFYQPASTDLDRACPGRTIT